MNSEEVTQPAVEQKESAAANDDPQAKTDEGDQSEAAEPSPKRARSASADEKEKDGKADDNANKEEIKEVLDLAVELGLKDGDRLEVEWQLEVDDSGTCVNKWWKSTLLPWDGKTEEGSVAVRKLEYDADASAGYDEKTIDEVIFLSHEILISPDSQAEFRYRPEGMIQFANEEELRKKFNDILMNAFSKHSEMWMKLDRSQQCKIAEDFAAKKESLIEAVMNHKSPVIGEDEMKELFQGVMSNNS